MEDDLSACCLTTGCFDCNKNTELIQTTPVLTPFYRPILETDDMKDGSPAPERNYVPYDLFTFRTKFERKLYHLDPTYHFSFVPKPLNGAMRVTIEIHKGNTFVPLSPVFAKKIQSMVDDSLSTFPGLCLLLDSRIPLNSGTKTLPKAWVGSLFPFLVLEERFHAILDSGGIYVDLSWDVAYVDLYHKMYMKMLDVLKEYYKKGVIPLSPKFHAQIIKDWDLEKVYEQYIKPGESDSPGEIALYECNWSNTQFAPDRIAFIYDRIAHNPDIKIHVGDNFVRRHFVAVELGNWGKRKFGPDFIPTFSGNYVLVQTENVLDTFEASNKVIEARSESSGRVEIVPLERVEDYEKVLKSILSEYVGLTPKTDIVLYKTLDVPKYLVSFLIPASEAADSLRILKAY